MAVLTWNDLWVADPLDPAYPLAPTTRVFSFNDLEDDCNAPGFGIADPVFAETFAEVRIGSADSSGTLQAAHGYGAGALSFRLFWKALSMETLVVQAQLLASLCDNGGVLGWQPKGVAAVRYLDFDSSGWPQIFAGQTSQLYRATGLLMSPDGMATTIITGPTMRLAPVTISSVSLSNDNDAREMIVVNPGNRPSEIVWEVTPSAGSLAEVRFACRDRGNLDEYATKYSWNPASGTNYTDTVDSTVDGRSAVTIDFSNVEPLWRRFRKVINLTDPTTLQGRHRLYAVLRADGMDPSLEDYRSEFYVQARYGFTTDDMVLSSLPARYLDWSNVDNPQFVMVELGDVSVGRTSQLVVDFWAARISGAQSLSVTQMVLMPTTWQTTIVGVPGWRSGSWGHERFSAEEFNGTGALQRDTYRLNNFGEVGYVRPSSGRLLPAGVHKLSIVATLKEADDSHPRRALGKIQLIEDPDGSGDGTVRKSARLWSHRNQEWTRREKDMHFRISSGDVLAGTKFGFRVKFTAPSVTGRGIRIAVLKHSFLPSISSSSPLTVDGLARRSWVHPPGSTAEMFGIPLEGDPPTTPPGSATWVWDFRHEAGDPGYADLDDREPLAPDPDGGAVTISGVIIPRVTH